MQLSSKNYTATVLESVPGLVTAVIPYTFFSARNRESRNEKVLMTSQGQSLCVPLRNV